MTRRWQSTGRFRRAAPLDDVPLLMAALQAKSAPHVAGWRVRKDRWRWKPAAKVAALQEEVAMERGWLV